MNRAAARSWLERLPKVELHVHLEGAIPYDALWALVEKYGGNESVSSRDQLARRFDYKDFSRFIEMWIWRNRFLREYEDFTFVAASVARDLAAQNIRYAEAFFSPPDFEGHGLETQRITEAVRKGFDREGGIEVALVADLVRDFGPERGAATLAQINEVRQLGVVGVGIGGAERDFPPEAYEDVFARARRMGFRTSAHAGEAAGAESIWGAIRALQVDRIGHGTRAEEDEALLNYLVERRIPVEVCPISNVRTGAVETYELHPVRRYFDRGMAISINTDDPKMFGNSLAMEYEWLMEKKGFARAEIKELVLEAIRTSWMLEERKQEMQDAFCREAAWSEAGGD